MIQKVGSVAKSMAQELHDTKQVCYIIVYKMYLFDYIN